MSTSLLYHAFGIRGHKYVNTRYDEGKVTFQIHKRKTDLCCPECRSHDVVRKGIGVMHEQINRLLEIPDAVYRGLQDGWWLFSAT